MYTLKRMLKGKGERAVARSLTIPLLGLLAVSSIGQAAPANLCVKKAVGTPVDGIVAPGVPTYACPSDTMWETVGPGLFEPSASSPVSHIYMARVGTDRLRIGIDTAGDPDVSDFDAVILFFDANNNDVWDNRDFAVKIAVSSSTMPITSGESCAEPGTGLVEYFQRSEDGWVSNGTAAGQILARYSYDYSSPDPESQIWNLEFEIPIAGSGAFNLNTDGPKFFSVGAYLFADFDHQQSPQQGQVRAWPGNITSKLTGISPDISAGAPGVSLLVSEPLPADLADIKFEGACGFDVNFSMAEEPWVINGNPANAGNEFVHRNALNKFRVTYYLDGPGSDPKPISSPGQVRLGLMPYNASGSMAGYWFKTASVNNTPMNYNATHTVDFEYNFSEAPSEQFNAASTQFVCADAYLEKFNLNDDKTNDNIHLNLNYFKTSEFTDSLKIYGPTKEMERGGPAKKVYIHMQASNETPALRGAAPAFRGGKECEEPRAEARWNITNARDLGLTQVKGTRDWYEMPLAPGEMKSLDLRFEGKPLGYKMKTHRLAAGVRGRPGRLDLAVKPGTVVTLLAFGDVDVDGKEGPLPPTTAAGFTQPIKEAPGPNREQLTGESFFGRDIKGRPLPPVMEHGNRYLLKDGYYAPNEHVGALIGSFDGFRTSFVVGRHKSIIVPPKAGKLSLAVNATMKSYATIIGGYEIGEIVTPAPAVPTKTVPNGNATYGVPNTVQPWDALTSLNIYTYYADDLVIDGGPVSRTFRPYGDAHYVLYASHASEAPIVRSNLTAATIKEAKRVRQ